ncbi:unnamed protein product [Brachyspira suanatina]|uniref:Uncharacterized protein n=1 Tax=Brachyspira suanatina TaxID=381802 RepID=A0A0G4K8V6_9SPIR|nr:hypothetical protein [Brachyspira suanatina]CRF34498.1 unnamed protein product [Brachyspira suanatina]
MDKKNINNIDDMLAKNQCIYDNEIDFIELMKINFNEKENKIIIGGTLYRNKETGEISYSVVINFDFNLKSILTQSGYKDLTDKEIIFHCIIFNKQFRANNTDFYSISFLNVNFNEEVKFFMVLFNRVYFEASRIMNEFTFLYCTIDNGIEIQGSTINKLVFDTSTLYSDSVILSSTIKYLYFYSLELDGNFNISNINRVQYPVRQNSRYKEEDTFLDIRFINIKSPINNCNIILNNSYIDEFNKYDKLVFDSSIINGSVNISNVYAKEVYFNDIIILKGLNTAEFKYDKILDMNTARFLKNEELKKSNNIKALEYEAIEVNLYRKELLKKKNKKLKDFADILSIFLGYIYSSNCQNWIQALGITLLSIFVIFSIFYTNNLDTFNIFIYLQNIIQDVQTDNYWYRFIEYLIPTKYEHIMLYIKLETIPLYKKLFGALVYFLGKISFWYGSVHIIQSFRKFNRVS